MWQDQAACRDKDPRVFFPDSRDSALNRAFVREARRTCAACPVKVECGEFAQTSNNGRPEQWGVWSGRDMGPKKKAEPKRPVWKRVEERLRESVA